MSVLKIHLLCWESDWDGSPIGSGATSGGGHERGNPANGQDDVRHEHHDHVSCRERISIDRIGVVEEHQRSSSTSDTHDFLLSCLVVDCQQSK